MSNDVAVNPMEVSMFKNLNEAALAAMKARGESSTAFAAALGLSLWAFGDRLAGRCGWSLRDLEALAKVTGKSTDELLGQVPR
jgi:hypothetical protein